MSKIGTTHFLFNTEKAEDTEILSVYLHSSNSKCFSRSSAGTTKVSGMKDQLSDALSVTF